jgi:hypothetical protein
MSSGSSRSGRNKDMKKSRTHKMKTKSATTTDGSR